MNLCGLRPSPPDDRDWPIHKLGVDMGASIPAEVSYDSLVTIVYDQDGGTCVGESTARAWNLRALIQGARNALYPDPNAIFALANAVELGDPKLPIEDNGAIPRCALQAVKENGVLPRGLWSDRLTRPDWATITNMADRRVIKYARCANAYQARQALAAGFPVKNGGPIDRAYTKWTTGVYPGLTGPILGRHDRCLIGYGSGWFLEINSWGALDAVRGRRKLSDVAVEECELWAMELVTP